MESDNNFLPKKKVINIIEVTKKEIVRDEKSKLCNEFLKQILENKISLDKIDYEDKLKEILNEPEFNSIKDELKNILPSYWRFKKDGFTPKISFNDRNELTLVPTSEFNLGNDIGEQWKFYIQTMPYLVEDKYMEKLRTPKFNELFEIISKDKEILEIFDIILTMFHNKWVIGEKNIENLVVEIKKMYLIMNDEQKIIVDRNKMLKEILFKAGIKFMEYYPEYENIKINKQYSQEEKDLVYKLGFDKFDTWDFAFIVLVYRHKNENDFIELFCDETFEKLDVTNLNNLQYFAKKFYNSYSH